MEIKYRVGKKEMEIERKRIKVSKRERALMKVMCDGETHWLEEIKEEMYRKERKGVDKERGARIVISRLNKRLGGEVIRRIAEGRYRIEGEIEIE